MDRHVNKIIIDENLAEGLSLAAKNPYFMLVQTENGVYSNISEGFYLDNVIEFLVEYAKTNELGPSFKDAISDMLLDLYKEK